jgi:hypothetical protein
VPEAGQPAAETAPQPGPDATTERAAAAAPQPDPDAAEPAGAVPAWLDLWAELGGGVDGNPARAPGSDQPAEGFAWLLGRARARLEGERASAVITLTEAGRLYPGYRGADALASRLEVSARARLGGGATAALSGLAADTTERSGQLDRHLLRGEGSLALRHRALQGSLAGGWFLFAPREPSLRPFRAEGPEGWLRLGWAVAEEHQLSLSGGLSSASFPDWAEAGAPGSPVRDDRAQLLSAGWSWRGPALLSLGWDYTDNRSTAPGGDFTRHRVTASGAFRLPLGLTLATRLALQWSHYPDPLLLPAEQRLAEGREALDQVEARLTRAIGGPLEASLALAWYHVDAGEGVPGYQRAVATLALGWRSRAVSP